MDKDKNINLDEILQHSDLVKVTGKVKFYSLKYSFRNKKDNFAICLPSNLDGQFLTDVCTYLETLSDRRSVPFNPVSYEEGTYEYLSLDEIRDHWDDILELISDLKDFKDDENKKRMSASNLSICLLQHKGERYYLCSQQHTLTGLLKGKKVLMSGSDKLEKVDSGKLFLLSNRVDFAICAPGSAKENLVFIFNRQNFISVFRFYEHLKHSVKEKLSEVDKWEFLSSTELIKSKSEQKNIYLNLAKVFSDQDYLQQMRQVRPDELKKRLLNKSGGSFTEGDFDGEKILLTSKNLGKVMKMLAKGFKYNFFADRAEED